MNAEKICIAIKTLRKRKNLTQHQLADKLGVTDKAVSKWERGLGTPDISMLNKLALILDIDTDNLLEGNIAYLDNNWVGVLRLDLFDTDISFTNEIYGKPSVYFYFCYFLLAGINEIFIYCDEASEKWLLKRVGDGSQYGLMLHYNSQTELRDYKRMEIYGPIFVYGPNLTKYFQRAMSQKSTNVTLVLPDKLGDVYLNGKHQVSDASSNRQAYKRIPVTFKLKNSVYQSYEPMGNGMIGFEIMKFDDIVDISNLFRMVNRTSGNRVYCLEEIAFRRGFINQEQLEILAKGDKYLLTLVNDKSVDMMEQSR